MHVERSRITLLSGAVALALSVSIGLGTRARPDTLPGVTVYKSPT